MSSHHSSMPAAVGDQYVPPVRLPPAKPHPHGAAMGGGQRGEFFAIVLPRPPHDRGRTFVLVALVTYAIIGAPAPDLVFGQWTCPTMCLSWRFGSSVVPHRAGVISTRWRPCACARSSWRL